MTLCPYGHLPVLQGVTPQCGEMSRSDRGDVAVSLLSLWSGQGLTALVGCGAKPRMTTKRFAKGELKNSPVDCFLRGNAFSCKAFPDSTSFYIWCVKYNFLYISNNICKSSGGADNEHKRTHPLFRQTS